MHKHHSRDGQTIAVTDTYPKAEMLIAQLHAEGTALSEISLIAPRTLVRTAAPLNSTPNVGFYVMGVTRLLSNGKTMHDSDVGPIYAAGPVMEELDSVEGGALSECLRRSGVERKHSEWCVGQLQQGRPVILIRNANPKALALAVKSTGALTQSSEQPADDKEMEAVA